MGNYIATSNYIIYRKCDEICWRQKNVLEAQSSSFYYAAQHSKTLLMCIYTNTRRKLKISFLSFLKCGIRGTEWSQYEVESLKREKPFSYIHPSYDISSSLRLRFPQIVFSLEKDYCAYVHGEKGSGGLEASLGPYDEKEGNRIEYFIEVV